MAPPDPLRERNVLLWSITATAGLGGLGVAWGLATGSQMIMLDGVYAVIGIAVSWLLLRASALAGEGPSRHYPYGRQAATPIVIGIQGFVLLGTLVYAAVQAVNAILDGGVDVAPGWALVYGVITTVGSVLVWLWLRSVAGRSDVLVAESSAWGVGSYRGLGMVIGFGAMALLTGSAWDRAVPYIDPVMVLATCVLFVATPIRMVRHTVLELLERAPPAEIRQPVLAAIAAVRETFDLAEPEVRMTKIGPKLYLEVEGVAAADVTLAQEHEVREDLRRRLEPLPYDVWLTVELLPRDTPVTPPEVGNDP